MTNEEEKTLRNALALSKRTEDEWGRMAANYAIKAEAADSLVSMWRAKYDRLERELASERDSNEQAKEIEGKILADLDRAVATNKRLRSLIKDAEKGTEDYCPWCNANFRDRAKHMPTCPAFTAEGDVK